MGNKKRNNKSISYKENPPVLSSITSYGQSEATALLPFGPFAAQIISEATTRPQPFTDIEQLIHNSGVELKSFYAGSEYSYRRGFDAGHGRGFLFGFLAGLFFLQISGATKKS